MAGVWLSVIKSYLVTRFDKQMLQRPVLLEGRAFQVSFFTVYTCVI